MLRTQFEDGVLFDAITWYATVDNSNLVLKNEDYETIKETITPERLKEITEAYWRNYFA